MTLDAAKSDAEYIEMHAQRTGRPPSNPVTPLRSGPKGDYTSRRRPKALEHDIQRAFFAMIDNPATQKLHPELALFHSNPNGGHRTPAAAGKMKAEGQRPGVPDTHLPIARGGYHGLWIEFKKPGGTTSPEQAHWMTALARHGHKVALHTSADSAWLETLAYLALATPDTP